MASSGCGDVAACTSAYRSVLPGWLGATIELRKTSVMVSRHLLHWPWRTAGGVLGLALSVAVLVGSLWSVGGVDFMIDYTFNKTERQDATINFSGTKPASAAQAVARLPGVLAVEPFRALGVEISSGPVTRRVAIIGRPAAGTLTKLLDGSLTRVDIPDAGLLLTRSLADILRVRPGDVVNILPLAGDRRSRAVQVSALVEGYLGLGAYMELNALQDLISEGHRISRRQHHHRYAEAERVVRAAKQTPSLGQISMQTVALQQFRATMAQNLFVMIGVLVSLAAIVAFGVVYNFAAYRCRNRDGKWPASGCSALPAPKCLLCCLPKSRCSRCSRNHWVGALGFMIAFGMVKGFSSEIFLHALRPRARSVCLF